MGLRIGEAAERLGVCPDTLRRYERDGIIHSVRFGNQRRFDEQDIEDLKRTGTNTRQAIQASKKRAEALEYRRAGKLARQRAAAAYEQQGRS